METHILHTFHIQSSSIVVSKSPPPARAGRGRKAVDYVFGFFVSQLLKIFKNCYNTEYWDINKLQKTQGKKSGSLVRKLGYQGRQKSKKRPYL